MRRFVERYGFILGYLALAALVGAGVYYLVQKQVDNVFKGLLIGGIVLAVAFVLARLEDVVAVGGRFVKRYGYVFGYLALVGLAAGGVRYLIWRQLDGWVEGLLIGGAVCGALFILVRPAQVAAALTGRSVRYGSNAVLMSLAFVGILIGLNYLAGRYHHRFDVTELKEHTLSPQSVQVLAELDQPVEIIGFFGTDGYQQASFEELLDLYLDETDQVSYTVIDPDREPIRAQQYEPVPYEGLLFQSGERTETVYTAGEQEITSALLKVTSEGKKVIYFLTGHQERDPQGYDEDGYSTVVEILRAQNYEVRTLNLAITATVPADAAVLVVAAPQTELLDEELPRLEAYLSRGGKALVMQDPFNEAGLNDVLSAWQVAFGEGVVIDPASMAYPYAYWPVVSNYRFDQITKDLSMTVFPLARPVEQTGQDADAGITFNALAATTAESWAEMDEESSELVLDEGVDTPGPLNLVASVEVAPTAESADPEAKTRLVLVGDSDFASNAFAQSGGGSGLLFLNAVNWLAEEESLIAIGPKSTQPRQVFLTGIQATAIPVFSILLIPGALVVVAIVVWWHRR